ncbi:MAG: glycosyltransferase family 25 protein [Candidatus Electrothrix sp. YB6]
MNDRLENYFDKIYVVNLPERIDRRREITEALQRIGISFTPGKVELFPAVKPTEAAGFSSPGVRGCFLSHLSILRKAAELDLSNVLVIEDDVEFVSIFEQLWPAMQQQLQDASWNFAYLGYTHVEGSTLASRKTEHVEMRPLPDSLRCTHAYAVSRPTFAPLIEHLEELEQHRPIDVDGAFNVFRRKYPETLTLIAEPQVIRDRASHSDLHNTGWRATWVMRILLQPARRIKNFFRRRQF